MANYSEPGGQNVDILESIINNTEYTEEPRSQISALLLQLKEVIESGGGETIVDVTELPTGTDIKDVIYRLKTESTETTTLAIVSSKTQSVANCEALGFTTTQTTISGTTYYTCKPAENTTVSLSDGMTTYSPVDYITFGESAVVSVNGVAKGLIPMTYDATIITATYTLYIGNSETQTVTELAAGGGNSDIYSTDETVIGTFLGKPLYRKVLAFTNTRIANGVELAHGISDMKMCTKISGFHYKDSGQYITQLIPWQGNLFFRLVTPTSVTFSGNDYFNAEADVTIYIIMEYTKTTD